MGFDNEPMARLAEQRLREQGIPCLTRSLRGGPGLWGSSFNLPHEILVFETDEMKARDLLELPPLEIAERQRGETGAAQQGLDRRLLITGVVIAFVVVALILQI
ncbi:MAG: hypothetical protein BZY88_04825 [SAR202 cluster bacterium Io17-Chloro-G9]|nr:MAG: hypothetical protein BZY88_04825 [SAR202 cluster bacterium Io17-Chloro-G9]